MSNMFINNNTNKTYLYIIKDLSIKENYLNFTYLTHI